MKVLSTLRILPSPTHSPKHLVMTVNIKGKKKRNALLLSRTIDCVYIREQKVWRWHLHAKIALDQGGNILPRGHMSLKVIRAACEKILAANNAFAFTCLHVRLRIIAILNIITRWGALFKVVPPQIPTLFPQTAYVVCARLRSYFAGYSLFKPAVRRLHAGFLLHGWRQFPNDRPSSFHSAGI